ncbi:MAG: hypothetical protein D5R97_09870 [Candidatus Syntrophonatronum acetioxidans]|uniref:Methionine synthase n=1 Tax=Candidatus Syntrophonatronum acetioxidans TaxID=1795816 RepID=A0A424Y9L6_9FIRM|nr:MAG: hypothetical protein D5R97_09870 [Candidatus Syntrophonatronum acetioxidans]
MDLKGDCQTTAMGIMPHQDIERALELSLSLDIPFWPQLPRVSFFEDMYAQLSEHFPGIILDTDKRNIKFSLEKFYEEIDQLLANWDNEEYFRLSTDYSLLFHKFLDLDLSPYQYIRGQSIGPVSYGLKILDQNKKSMIYHEEVRGIIFDFVAKKVQAQYNEMKNKHEGAFVWVDEPGLQMIFMAYTGYTSDKAFKDYQAFLDKFPGPKGVHLCGNPDWSFLLQLDLDILSLDVLAWGQVFSGYREEVKEFLDKGGIISWGITPTLTEEYEKENLKTMIDKLEDIWNNLEREGVSRQQILAQSWLAPARCCLVNADKELTVEKSFDLLKSVADHYKKEL